MKLKGSILAIAAAGVASSLILAGLAVNVASGAPTDTTPTATVTAGNPPAAPVEPPSTAPGTGTNPDGSQFGVNNSPGGSPAGASNLPDAGFGPDAGSGIDAGTGALVLLGLAGFALVTAGATLSRKRGS